MATQTPLDRKIKSILKYDASYPYFGELKFSELYDAQRYMRRDEYYNANGTRDARVYIGKIDGNIICGALWRLMGYNPGRFTANPFLYNGRNNIFRFAADRAQFFSDSVTDNLVIGLRGKMREYLTANAGENGQWQDEIKTVYGGYVYTVLKDGRTGTMYKKLCILRDAVQMLTRQNCADFDSKRGPYRDRIIQAVGQRHPERFGVSAPVKAPVQSAVTAPADDYSDEDKIYEKMDQLQITLDNQSNISPDLYEQAVAEMNMLIQDLYEIRRRHTL